MTTTNKNRTQTNIKLFVLFVLLTFSATGAFAQTSKSSVVETTSTEVSILKGATFVINNDDAVASSTIEFAIWFMGSKKTTNDNSSNGTFSKKQLINSGINTNNVLIRSFLKKVFTQEKSIA